MKITFDPSKRDKTLAERGLDFLDAQSLFDGVTVDFEDRRTITVKSASSALAASMVAPSSSHGPRVARIATSSA